MRRNFYSAVQLRVALLTVLAWGLVVTCYGQVPGVPLVANASNFKELSKWIANPNVGSIVLRNNIVLEQSLIINRKTALSIGSPSSGTTCNISCVRIGPASAAFELKASSKLTLAYMSFENCTTALKVESPQPLPDSFPNVRMDSVSFQGSGAVGDLGGAIVWQVPAGDLIVFKSTFVEAKARQGGAIFASGGGNVTITNSTFISNTASELGGAIMFGANLRAAVNSCTFINNRAEEAGGAIAADPGADSLSGTNDAKPTYVQVTSSKFTSNVAVSVGGAVLCLQCDQMLLYDNVFEFNKLDGDGATLGGAVALIANKSDFAISGATFEGNEAAFGGALFLNNTCSSPSTCPISIRVDHAKGNKATQSGSFLHSMDPGPVSLCCGGTGPCAKQDTSGCSNPAVAEDLAPTNTTVSGVAGPPVSVKIASATLMESVLSVKVQLLQSSGGLSVMPEPVTLTIGLIDSNDKTLIFIGNTSTSTDKGEVDWPTLQIFPPPNSNFDVIVNASITSVGVITGRETVTVTPCPVGSYNDTAKGVCASCSSHKLFSLSPSVPCFNCFNGAICKEGLVLPKAGFWMTNMLLPQLQWCPLDSACGVAHRHRGLLNTTLNFQQDLIINPTAFATAAYTYNATFMQQQCRQGYTGTFCAQCAKGYGLSGKKCVPCNGRGGTIVLFMLCMLFLVAVISVTMLTHVRGSRLLSMGEASRVLITGGMVGGVVHTNGAAQEHHDMHDGSPWHMDEDGQRPHLFDLALVLDNAHKMRNAQGRPPTGLEMRIGGRPAIGISPAFNTRQSALDPTPEEQRAAEYFLLTAMIKILVTYVQLVSMLAGLKLRWPAELRRFIFFVDYTSCASWLPLPCALSGSEQNKAIATTVLYVVIFPVCVVTATIMLWAVVLRPFFVATPTSAAARDAEGMSDLVSRRSANSMDEPHIVFHTTYENKRGIAKKRSLAALVQCVYYMYPFVTTRILQVFVCMQVGQMSTALWDAYKDFLPAGVERVAPGFYWLQSSAVRCFTDAAHRNLAISVGVFGTSFWIVGVPCLLLWGAYCHRHSNRLSNGALSWGFVYLEYRPELWYWEFLVCLRKLSVMISAHLLVVGRGPLSAGQLYATMVFVVLGWLVHEVFRPFTDTALAAMDRCSSFGVVVALIVIAFKLNSQADSPIDTVLMVVVILVVMTTLVFLLTRICMQLVRLHKGWHYFQDAETKAMAGKEGRGGSDGGGMKHVVGVDAQPGPRNSSDWLGGAIETFLERASGLFRRNRNPLHDLAKRAWTRPPVRPSSSMEHSVPSRASGVLA